MQILYSPEVYGSGRGVQEVAVWNLDGLGSGDDVVAALVSREVARRPLMLGETPPEKKGVPPWLMVLSAVVPVTLLLAWAVKRSRR